MSDTGLEECLSVGLDVFLDTEPGQHNARRYPGNIRGWEVDKYILLNLKRGANVPTVRRGKECVVRFMHEGEVWGFTSLVGDCSDRVESPLIHLTWPKEVARLQVRKHERVGIRISCTVHLENDTTQPGTIGDISGGGCSVATSHKMEVGESVHLSFLMPDGDSVSRRPVIIRNRRAQAGNCFSYGCQYQEEKEEDRGIELFVARKIAQERGEAAPHPQILLLSRETEDVRVARHELSDSPYEIIASTGLLDLGHRLHLCNAVAILISFEQKELSAIEILPLIKQTEGFGEIPLFVYGGGDGLREQASSGGATACLNDLSSVRDIIPHLPEIAVPEKAEDDAEGEAGEDSQAEREDVEADAESLEANLEEGDEDDDDDDDDDEEEIAL